MEEQKPKRPVGRPKFPDEMVTMQFRVPKKLITVAEGLDIPYKKLLRTSFEKMVCVSILTRRGESCEICEQVIERNRIINEQLKTTLEEMAIKLVQDKKAEGEMARIIGRAVRNGRTRGEAEMEYGKVFPDAIWKKYGEV